MSMIALMIALMIPSMIILPLFQYHSVIDLSRNLRFIVSVLCLQVLIFKYGFQVLCIRCITVHIEISYIQNS